MLADTSNGLFKAKVIQQRRPWRSFEAVELATFGWVDWFNHSRLLEPIGNVFPAEAEARYYAQLAATLTAEQDSGEGSNGNPGRSAATRDAIGAGKIDLGHEPRFGESRNILTQPRHQEQADL